MPDDIVGGDTIEGAVPAEAGDTAGSTTDETGISPETGIAPGASVPDELPEGLRDKYVSLDRYQNLESKLGNWSQTQQAAEQYNQLMQDPRIQAALQPSVAQPEQLPDFTTMEPQDVISFMDKRSDERAQKLFDQKIAEYEGKNIKPLQDAVFTREANEQVARLAAKYPDFKDNAPAIDQFITKNNLGDQLNDEILEMAYRYVTFEKQQAEGAKQAVKKLQTKAKDTAIKPQGAAPAGKAKPKSIADAWAQAEEGTI